MKRRLPAIGHIQAQETGCGGDIIGVRLPSFFVVCKCICVWERNNDGEEELVDTVHCSLESVGDVV